jgi:hypothetical protein
MIINDRLGVLQLIPAKVNRVAGSDRPAPAKHAAYRLGAGSDTAALGWQPGDGAHFRPHLWPQSFSTKDMHCLACGVFFWARQAEGPCRRRTQGDVDASYSPAVSSEPIDRDPDCLRHRVKRVRNASR